MLLCIKRTVGTSDFIFALEILLWGHQFVNVCVRLWSKSLVATCNFRVDKTFILTLLGFLCNFVQIQLLKNGSPFCVFMHQMKGFLWNKRRLFLAFKLLEVAEVLMFYCPNFWSLQSFRFFGRTLCFFGSDCFYGFISGRNGFILIELNPGIFKFGFVNNNSMIKLSDRFQRLLNFLERKIRLEK